MSVYDRGMRKGEATRAKMIEAAATLFEREGYSGAGLNAILEASDAPRGSLYFHFPGGKEELAVAAIEAAAARLTADITVALAGARKPVPALTRVVDLLAARSEGANCENGCPIASVVASSSGAPEAVRLAASRALAGLESALAAYLVAQGLAAREAAQRAGLFLCAVEGALVLARVHRSSAPLTRLAKSLPTLLGEG
jgi:TetR/AcrR family transcriptional repressor of lmrAB and yxaGH operons